MTRPDLFSQLGSQFDDFLFAPVGEEVNGGRLSVLSALARLNLDPWAQAAELAQLPKGAAVEKLASLLATLPTGSYTRRDSASIAARLVALLPRQPNNGPSSGSRLFSTKAKINPWLLAAFAIFLILQLAAHLVAPDRHATAPPCANTATIACTN